VGSPEQPGIPAHNGFNGFLRDLPGDRLCCHRRFAVDPQNLTPASRRQDHTTSPSAFSTVRQRRVRIHRIPPRVRDDRERPLVRRDGAIRTVFCLEYKRIYFCGWGWTGDLPVRHRALWRGRPCAHSHHCERSEGNPALNEKLDSTSWIASSLHSSQ
jgi:hypothetical protein